MQHTPNYNLTKYEDTDFFVKEYLNDNMEAIDLALKDMQDTINTDGNVAVVEEIQAARRGKATLVEKVTEIDTNIGTMANLTTTVKTSLVNAVNETVAEIDFNKARLDNLFVDIVKDYGADPTGVTDCTTLINTALASKQGVTVYLPLGKYKVTGKLDIPSYAKLVGERRGMTQGSGTHVYDENSVYVTGRNTLPVESLLLLYPNDMVNPTITIHRQCVIQGLGIIYPDQNSSASTEDQVIKFPTTIVASHGCNIWNVRVWGANNFLDATGECINVKDLYGYAVGTAISIKTSGDVCRLENIHLNPNVIRPADSFKNLCKARANNVAFYFEDADGVLMNNIHVYGYRTAVKVKGGSGSAQCSFQINNYMFDTVGVAFDVDSDSGWGLQSNNGVIIVGFSDVTSYAGLLRLSRTISQTQLVPLVFNNLNLSLHPSYVTPDYYINFIYQYSWDIRFSNTNVTSLTNFLSTHNSYVHGRIRCGNGEIVLEKTWQKKSLLKNGDLQLDANADGTPDSWTKDLGTGDLTVSTDISGFMKLSTTSGLLAYKGLFQRVVLPTTSVVSIIVKARGVSATSQICFITYDTGYTNAANNYLTFDGNGIAQFTTSAAKAILDTIICPGTAASSSIVIESVQLIADGRRYFVV